jgi:hypothetical protein
MKLITFISNYWLFILVGVILLIILPRGYYSFYPSLLPFYPSNEEEIKDVIAARKKLDDGSPESNDMLKFFYRTDSSVVYAFYDSLGISLSKLVDIVQSPISFFIIYLFKYIHNRKRPNQIITNISLDSKTANTPSYPSGHAFQAYLIAKTLSKEYPHLKDKLYKIADKCAYVRVAAGLHFPSDSIYAKQLVEGNVVPL